MLSVVRPRLQQGVVDPVRLSVLTGLLQRIVDTDPRLKASVGAMWREPSRRPLSDQTVEWFWRSPLPAIVAELVGETPMLLVEFTTIRRHTPGRAGTRVGWHLDANFVGLDNRTITAWLPVDPVGFDAPGLEFAIPQMPVSTGAIERALATAEPNGGTLTDDQLAATLGGRFQSWRPRLDPGDILLFDQWTFHRTDPAVDRAPRTAIEFRMVAPSNPPRRLLSEDWILASVPAADDRWTIDSAVNLCRTYATAHQG